jgi:hypothetical protein
MRLIFQLQYQILENRGRPYTRRVWGSANKDKEMELDNNAPSRHPTRSRHSCAVPPSSDFPKVVFTRGKEARVRIGLDVFAECSPKPIGWTAYGVRRLMSPPCRVPIPVDLVSRVSGIDPSRFAYFLYEVRIGRVPFIASSNCFAMTVFRIAKSGVEDSRAAHWTDVQRQEVAEGHRAFFQQERASVGTFAHRRACHMVEVAPEPRPLARNP